MREGEGNTNIIDTPLRSTKDDRLDTGKYVKGLARYLSNSSMPTTVAIQGQWGSGKTSFMNQLRSLLCEKTEEGDPLYYGVWINMWEYSIMQTPEQTLIGVIKGMINECSAILNSLNAPKAPINDLADKAWSFFKKAGAAIASSAVKAGVNAIGLDGNEVASAVTSALTDKPFNEANPNEFRDAFAHAVTTCLQSQPKEQTKRRGFMFFIDDLDRINPENAVQILELLKNMFEVSNCIFVLAIDYDVVVKGLKTKFGNNGSNDDRAFRSFFDKIIQMPFTMPVGAYDITSFLEDSLKNINYLSGDELHREIVVKQGGTDVPTKVIDVIDEMTRLSTGANPRSIKRLINTLSLIKIINTMNFDEGDDDGKEQGLSAQDLLMNYGLVCLQIAYPQIYDHIMQEPCFIEWDESTARIFRLPQLTGDKKAILENVDEFDEPWEQVVYQLCQTSTYLTASALNISQLLNTIRSLFDEEIFESKINQLLGMTAVTSVSQSENKAIKAAPATPTRQQSLDFWQTFNDFAFAKTEFSKEFKKRKPNTANWMNFSIGSSACHISVTQIQTKNKIVVELHIKSDKELFRNLRSHKDEIESEMGMALDWRELPEKKASRILAEKNAQLADRNSWPQQFEYIVDVCIKMKKAFRQYLL